MAMRMRVMPAQAGIQNAANGWIPAFAGMTVKALISAHDFVNAKSLKNTEACLGFGGWIMTFREVRDFVRIDVCSPEMIAPQRATHAGVLRP